MAGSRFTYAIGQLVLWSPNAHYVDAQRRSSQDGRLLAPLARQPQSSRPMALQPAQVLDKRGLTAQLQPRIVTGETLPGHHQFVASGKRPVRGRRCRR